MDIEQQVATHYRHGSLGTAILEALAASGKNIDTLQPQDLSAADEFHLGWRAQTVELGRQLALSHDMRILDIGSGIGGPARYFAETYGARVTGVDITDEFVEVATDLTRRCGLGHLVEFKQASALDMPFKSGSFDVATLLHVGMNIADKRKLFEETQRVLKPGGRFGVYDIMSTGGAKLFYPMPWAVTEATSFVETLETYRALLQAAGFRIEQQRDRSPFVLKLGREMREEVERHGVPPLGPHLLGPAMRERMANVMKSLAEGLIAPIEIVATAN